MGGLGSGGKRVGSGRKSKGATLLRLHGGRDRARTPAVDASTPVLHVDPPAALPADQLAVWQALAPHAMAARTLTTSTIGSFCDLCQAVTLRDRLLAVIEAQGWTFSKAVLDGNGNVVSREIKKHPLVADHRGWEQRVEAGAGAIPARADWEGCRGGAQGTGAVSAGDIAGAGADETSQVGWPAPRR